MRGGWHGSRHEGHYRDAEGISMSNAVLGPTNYFTTAGATITDTGHATGFGAANLAGPIALPGWQSDNTLTRSVRIDMGSAVEWDAIGFFRTNFTSLATFRLTLSNVSLGGTDIYDSHT